ncbi:TAXI family TRAP transporter solute-binding subunit [Litorivicinus lipolyticus]|nr:TAXI family TRAP transporter solute-binding subunit [Litorivicinus lipolyticus]
MSASVLGASAQGNYQKFIALGSGSSVGTYYQVANTLCHAINDERLVHGVRCINRSTGGSIYNIKALQAGQLDMAITRRDLLDAAMDAQSSRPDLEVGVGLRYLKSLYSMPLVAFSRADSGINGLNDILGKRVNIGAKGSGKRSAASAIFDALGWSSSDFSELTELSSAAMVEAFCDGTIDVFFEALANPNAMYATIIDDCNGRLIEMSPAIIDRVLAANSAFKLTPIAAGLYNHHAGESKAIGFEAVLATTDALTDGTVDIIMQLVSQVESP